MYCYSCGKELEEGKKFCTRCGADTSEKAFSTCLCIKCGSEMEMTDRFCPNCGATRLIITCECKEEISNKAKFCPHCGIPNKNRAMTKKEITAKNIKLAAVICAVIAVLGGGTLAFVRFAMPAINYNNASSLLESGEFDKARNKFEKLGAYKDSQEMAKECVYQQALSFVENNDYLAASENLSSLGEYKDSKELIVTYEKEIEYAKAMEALEAGEYYSAKEAFTKLSDFKDSADMVTECDYRVAKAFFENGEYAAASDAFKKLENYKDSSEMVSESVYLYAKQYLEEGKYSDAKTKFKTISGYKDSEDMIKECDYLRAKNYLENEKMYSSAEVWFNELGDYKDSEELLKQCCYELGVKKLETNPLTAIEYLTKAGDYKDAAEKLAEAEKAQEEKIQKEEEEKKKEEEEKKAKQQKVEKYKPYVECYVNDYYYQILPKNVPEDYNNHPEMRILMSEITVSRSDYAQDDVYYDISPNGFNLFNDNFDLYTILYTLEIKIGDRVIKGPSIDEYDSGEYAYCDWCGLSTGGNDFYFVYGTHEAQEFAEYMYESNDIVVNLYKVSGQYRGLGYDTELIGSYTLVQSEIDEFRAIYELSKILKEDPTLVEYLI